MAKNTHPLKAYREERGLSVSRMAEMAKTSRQSIFRIEKGDQTPSLKLIAKITKATKGVVTANDFMEGRT